MIYEDLGKRIREERMHLHLTQAQLAADINISDTYMGSIERGERCVQLDTLIRLAERLDVTVDYLLSDALPDSDSNIIIQIQQILDGRSLEQKQMAIDILRTMFKHIDNHQQ